MTRKFRKDKRSKWINHIRAWSSSGMTQASYCRKHNLSIKSFYYFRKKHKGISASTELVPVNFKIEAMRPSKPLCLNIDSRYTIEINKGFDPETLKQVLNVLNPS